MQNANLAMATHLTSKHLLKDKIYLQAKSVQFFNSLKDDSPTASASNVSSTSAASIKEGELSMGDETLSEASTTSLKPWDNY